MSRMCIIAALVWIAACNTQVAVPAEQVVQGELEVRVVDAPSFKASREEYFLVVGGQRLPLAFTDGAPEGLLSGQRVTVRGAQGGQRFMARTVEVDRQVAAMQATSGGCGVTGVQRSLVILAAFPGVPQPAATPQGIHDAFFSTTQRSLATYWSEVSEGRTTTTGAVRGWYTLDRAYSCSETDAMRDAAVRAADADVDFRQYDRIFIVHPNPLQGCAYAGQATLSCGQVATADGTVTASVAWLVADWMTNPDTAVKLVTHEAGHNLSLNHAGSRDFGAEPLGMPGTLGSIDEYGDRFSSMGDWNLGHYAAPHKARIGWLASSSVARVDGTGGTFTLAPVVASGGLKALQVRRRPGVNDWLWVEYRRPVGLYESTLASQVFGGALIHLADADTRDGTHLLDFTPGTSSWNDPALLPGTTWNDPYSDLTLTVDAATPTGLTVRVQYRTTTCVQAAPEVRVTPLAPAIWPGARPEFALELINRDSAGCGPSTFQLSPIVPAGWGFDPLPAQRTLAAASSGMLGLQTYVPYSAPLGHYTAGATVTRGGQSVQGTATVEVVERCIATPPTLTLSPASVTAAPGEDVTWTVSVTNNDSASCNWVWYDFGSTLPEGWDTAWSDWGVNLPPGGDSTFTMTKTVPPGASGPYTVDLSIYQEDVGLAASATATVNVAASAR
ncbi:NEW3 domain-containing protein [Corallococcus interemptor]|uniref:NEW3 domain-containing protein n=1 Tax=Corallococcus interemptor TaxID=2316720 RepID=UPI003D051F93